jgi:hypothetical protein
VQRNRIPMATSMRMPTRLMQTKSTQTIYHREQAGTPTTATSS